MIVANDNEFTGRAKAAAHNAQLKAQAEERRAQRRAQGIARAADHNHGLIVDKHKRIYGGYQIPMFG